MGLFDKLLGNSSNTPTNNGPEAPAPTFETLSQSSQSQGREVSLDLNKPGILNLQKNDFLNLSKTQSTLENIRVSAGWDVQTKLFGSDFDLDLVAFLLDDSGRLTQKATNVVYYGDKSSQGIHLDHDNLTGAGDGDDENMFVNFNQVSSDVKQIVVAVVIYSGKERKQNFGQVRNAYVRLVDESQRPERELVRFNLTEDGGNATAVKFAELNRTDNGWTFKAVGDYFKASIGELAKAYQ